MRVLASAPPAALAAALTALLVVASVAAQQVSSVAAHSEAEEDGAHCPARSGVGRVGEAGAASHAGAALLQREQVVGTLHQELKATAQQQPEVSVAEPQPLVAGVPMPAANANVVLPVPLYVHSRRKCIGADGENPLLGDPFRRRCNSSLSEAPLPGLPDGELAAGVGEAGSEGEEAEVHEGEAKKAVILLLFFVLLLGVINQYLLERFFPFVPYTAAMFMEGLCIAIIQAIKRHNGRVVWGQFDSAVGLWANADPHMILFIFLPPLVFGEAMSLNVSLVKACFKQCVLLAGPGVLIGTFLTGVAGKYVLPYNWDWNISMLFGAILSATDPVAVVAIFNSLGVSPRLTMVISGESLFNDGTAYVLFQLCMMLCEGAQPSLYEVCHFLFKMATAGPLVGIVMGILTVWFLGLSAEEHTHGDPMGQVVVTVCCAYLSFFIAEEMDSSGMLALVSGGLVVANGAWPRFIARETLQTIWHAIEFVGNTVIFVLAGIIFGGMCFERRQLISYSDFFYLGVLYLVSMVIRTVMVGLLWIPLNNSGHPLTVQEGAVMVWSGMRGAVGLLMAVVADQNRYIAADARTLIIFHAGGMAALMQLINGPLTPKVLQFVGLMDSTDKATIIAEVQQRVANRTKEQMRKDLDGEETQGLFSQAVEAQVARLVFPPTDASPTAAGDDAPGTSPQRQSTRISTTTETNLGKVNMNQLRMLRESLLRVVKAAYWELVETGVLPRKTSATKVLLDSADLGMLNSAEEDGLCDWDVVAKRMQLGVYKTEEEYREYGNYKQFFHDFEHYQQQGIFTALSFIYAHETALNEVKAFMADGMGECLEESIIIQEVEDQNKTAAAYVETMSKAMVALAQNKMLARKLLEFQAAQVHDLANRGLISDNLAGEIEHELKKHASGLLRLKMEQAASLVLNPMSYVPVPPVMGMASGPLQRIASFFSHGHSRRRGESERRAESDDT
jgi:NhaP-type Na+/H+ or K+/H+ antiporter